MTKTYDENGNELISKKAVLNIVNKSIRQLNKEKSKAKGCEFYRNVSLVDVRIKLVEDIKKQVKEI